MVGTRPPLPVTLDRACGGTPPVPARFRLVSHAPAVVSVDSDVVVRVRTGNMWLVSLAVVAG